MSTPATAYIKSAIETLELVQQLLAHLTASQNVNSLVNFIAQIESKANARISSSLAQTLGMDIPVADQEGKPADYWKGVRDTARLAQKQWQSLQDATKFQQFLTSTQSSLSAKIMPEETPISPLEEILKSGPATQPVSAPVSPLEEILTTSTPTPTPPTPIPTTPFPTPTPTPSTPIPTTPSPTPTPTPSTPIPTTPSPTPTVTPSPPTPSSKPVTPVTPRTPESVATPPKQLQALDEALRSSGMDQPTTPPSPEPAASSLTDMLLAKDEAGTDQGEDDMLSLSLREALKILRDEDEE
ncbi:MAG: hypothetical protein ACFFFG_02980 [Candidatus Thorarchaeota archaeon]